MLAFPNLFSQIRQQIVNLKGFNCQYNQISVPQRLLVFVTYENSLSFQIVECLDIALRNQNVFRRNKTALDQSLRNRSPKISTANNSDFFIHTINHWFSFKIKQKMVRSMSNRTARNPL